MRLKKLWFAFVLVLLTAILTVSFTKLARSSIPQPTQASEVVAIDVQNDTFLLCWAVTEALSAVNQPQNASIIAVASSSWRECPPSARAEPDFGAATEPYEAANLYLRQQQYEQAIASYQRALDIGKQAIIQTNRDFVLEYGTFENILYKLGFAYFKLANFADRSHSLSQKEQALNGAKDALEIAASGMNVFSRTVEQSARSGRQTQTIRAQRSFDYLLQSRTLRLLQQVYIAQGEFNRALLASEQGRTIEIDQNIVNNLWSTESDSRQQRLIEIAETFSQISNLSIETIQKLARDENATLVSYSILSTEDDPQPPYRGESTSGGSIDAIEPPAPPSETLLTWVVQPTGNITFHQQKLDRPLTGIELEQTDSVDICRGQSGVAVSNLSGIVRRTRSCLGVIDRETETADESATLSSDEQLRSLYQVLIPPEVEALLPIDPEARIIFIPQGSLFFVPFAALKNAAGQYLIERHTILTSTSLRALLLPSTAQPSIASTTPEKMLVVGNPTTVPIQLRGSNSEGNSPSDSPEQLPPEQLPSSEQLPSPEQLPPLEQAGVEAQTIVDLFKPQFQISAFINQSAPEDFVTAQMPEAKIIHFATHGILEALPGASATQSDCFVQVRVSGFGFTEAEIQQRRDRLASRLRAECEAQIQRINTYSVRTASGAIVLSPAANDPANTDNGLLTAHEILKLRLNADLVVLSACNTGRGPLTAGGVIGLPFAFSVAGAHNIIVSLWAVPDDSTAELMTSFYQQLGTTQAQSDKAKALAQAMRGFIRSHPNAPPRDWAGFTLMGHDRAAPSALQI